ncbi:MAG TPA: hypothetical protein VGM41_20380, partial [Chitinophagaceae bacterium]
YESFFLLYADNELKPQEKKTVEAFLDAHPQYQGELVLLHAARMSPDTSIVYEGKQDLYRREEKERVVVFAWWRLAAAAIVLMLLGLWWLNRPKTAAPLPIANNSGQNKPAQQPATRQDPKPATAQTTVVSPSPALTAGTNSGNKKKDKQQVDKNNNALVKTTGDKKVQPVLPQTNNLPPLHKMPDDNQQVAENIPENDHLPQRPGPLPERPRHLIAINGVKTPGKENLINRLINTGQQDEGNPVAQLTSYDNNDQIDVLNTSVNKTTLRGILRKASRIIAKKTSTDDNTDDDQKHILIGSFAIAVK